MKSKHIQMIARELATNETFITAMGNLVNAVVHKNLVGALFREIDVEKGPEKQGDPEKRIEKKNVHILDFLCEYLPKLEGRLLGMQADVDSARNRSAEALQLQQQNTEKLDAIGSTLLSFEAVGLDLVTIRDSFVKLIERPQGAEIVYLQDPVKKTTGGGK